MDMTAGADMGACLCRTARQLAEGGPGRMQQMDDAQESALASALNDHLRHLRVLLSQSKSLARHVSYRITLCNQRTTKAMFVGSVDPAPLDKVAARCRDVGLDSFWATTDDAVQAGLCRRIICVALFLRSKLDASAPVPPSIARLLQRNQNLAELRNSGRKYIKIARKLGGLGALFWLPLDIPHSTYERYLNMDDEDVFSHLQSLSPQTERYGNTVQRLILGQLQDLPPSSSYHNLFVDYSDILPASDQLLLLMHALGGSGIPDMLLKSIRSPQRRWSAAGEMESRSASEFGLSPALIELASDDNLLSTVLGLPYATRFVDINDSGTVTWSLSSELSTFYSSVLQPQTVSELKTTALRVICFACPPCYEGNTFWTDPVKKVIWPPLEKLARPNTIQEPLRTQVLEAVLYFCERDSVPLRRTALQRAKALLRRTMPYYLHASVVLFESVLQRLDGELLKSKALIDDFLHHEHECKGGNAAGPRGTTPQPRTRRDAAIRGRLHISQIDNKIKCYDKDVPSFIYLWEAAPPMSGLDMEVTCRLQSAAARFFQSIGDFPAARASLEQFLSLNSARPAMRVNTHRLIVGRLADIYCEMGEYVRAADFLRPALNGIVDNADHNRRPHRRLLLAQTETLIGQNRLDDAAHLLEQQLPYVVPAQLNDLYDEQLHMRRLLAWARIAHLRVDCDRTAGPDCGGATEEALRRWRYTLKETRHLRALRTEGSFIHAAIYLSIAHAELLAGNIDASSQSWATGVDILRREKCEFWIPVVPTVWLRQIVVDMHKRQGWSFRMMLPGGRPDMTWP